MGPDACGGCKADLCGLSLRTEKVLHADETPAAISGDEVRWLERQAVLRSERLDPTRAKAAPGWMWVHTATTGDGLVFLGAHRRPRRRRSLRHPQGFPWRVRLQYAADAADRQVCCAI